MKSAAIGLLMVLGITNAYAKEITAIPDAYKQPYKYFSKSPAEVGSILNKKPNQVGNVIIDNKDIHLLLEARDNVIGYADVGIKATGPCSQKKAFNSLPLLEALGIDPAKLELNNKATHSHRYYDHKNKLKIVAMCSYDGAPLSVSFSRKYYMH
jgi:hypothetical protein